MIIVRSDFGGGPRHLNQLVSQLPSDVRIYMAYPEEGDPYADIWNKNERIKDILYIPYRDFSIKTLFELRRIIRKNKIDIIHSHGQGAGLYSRVLKMLCPSVKVIHTFHGISDIYQSYLKYLASKIVGAILAPFCDMYICVSNGEKKLSLARCFSKEANTVVVFNGIPEPNTLEYKKEINHPLRIVTLSRFDFSKNMDSMYQIAKYWSGSTDVQFVWVGDGEDRVRLEEKAIIERVPISFIGFSKEPIKHLKSCDLYLSTSRFEGLPYGLIEAISVGLPIIATDVKGNNEVVINGYNGYLFQREETAIKYIEEFLNNEIDYKMLSSNSLTLFKSHFTECKMINKTYGIYKKVLNIQ